jgi:hypothetical protein
VYPTPRSSQRSLAPGGNSVSVLCCAQKPLLSSQGFPCHPSGVLESSCSLSRSNLIAWFPVPFRLSSHTLEQKTKSPGLPPCYPNAGRVTSTLCKLKIEKFICYKNNGFIWKIYDWSQSKKILIRDENLPLFPRIRLRQQIKLFISKLFICPLLIFW